MLKSFVSSLPPSRPVDGFGEPDPSTPLGRRIATAFAALKTFQSGDDFKAEHMKSHPAFEGRSLNYIGHFCKKDFGFQFYVESGRPVYPTTAENTIKVLAYLEEFALEELKSHIGTTEEKNLHDYIEDVLKAVQEELPEATSVDADIPA